MRTFFALLRAAIVLAACNSPAPASREIVGTWEYQSQGFGEPNSVEVRTGRIVFRDDGTFEASNVSGVVLKVNNEKPVSGRGTWTVDQATPGLGRTSDRPSLTLTYDRHGIPYHAYFSRYRGESLLTFARDEEAGVWVKYQKVD